MDFSLFFRGIAIGFSIAAPVGPIGVLCIKRALDGGFAPGFAAGMGAATADFVYALVAVAGMAVVSESLAAGRLWLHLAGGAFLCYLAWGVLSSKAPGKIDQGTKSGINEGRDSDLETIKRQETIAVKTQSLPVIFLQTFLLTLTNPMTVLSFAALLSVFELSSTWLSPGALMLVGGVFAGSSIWWLALSLGTAGLRRSFNAMTMKLINMASGAVLAGFGLFAIASAVF